MLLKNQVVSLELAKKLKELGVEQESLFSWKPDRIQDPTMNELRLANTQWALFDQPPTSQDYSAFTVAELGEMLPDYVESWRESKDWVCKEMGRGPVISADTEADARGKLLIYLLENDLYKLPRKEVEG